MRLHVIRNLGRTTAVLTVLLLFAACGGDGGSGLWPFGDGGAGPPQKVELYAEFGEPLETLGETDPNAVEFRRLGEGFSRPDAMDRLRPADEKLEPIEGIPRTRIPLFFWNAGYIDEDLRIPEHQHELFFRDGLPLRVGIFEATGRFASAGDTGQQTFQVEEFELQPCRSARATKLQLFPGADHFCVWLGSQRCSVQRVRSSRHNHIGDDTDAPKGLDLDLYYRLRISSMCPEQKPVEMTLYLALSRDANGWDREKRLLRPETAKHDAVHAPADRIQVQCGDEENSDVKMFTGLEGHLSARFSIYGDEESRFGLRAIASTLEPGPRNRGLSSCPSGPLRVWGTVDEEAPIVAPTIPDSGDHGSELGY